MKIMLVIFTMCGNPVYVVGQDAQGPLVGDPSVAPQEAVEALYKLVNTKGALVLERRLEDLTGVRCT